MKKLFSIILFTVSAISCYTQGNTIHEVLDLGVLEPRGIDARYYYFDNNYTDDEGNDYVEVIESFFSKLDAISSDDSSIINKYSGMWKASVDNIDELYKYQDFASSFKEIQFGYNSYYGYSFRYFFDGNAPAYKMNDNVVSTIRSMGWIAPILRYEIVEERMYIYILDHDKWRLADFHQGGKVYFRKISDEYNPTSP